ncbi:MAG: HDIG domain-containing protein [Chthoniobacteraceae bacterium]|nr:HDIG domain-containing protein [Chthoniobacteraceae bacterium]
MIKFFERRRLIKKGLASPKQRRRRSRNEILHVLEGGYIAKFLLFAAFIAGLAALIFSGKQEHGLEKFLTSLLIALIALAQIWINHPRTFASNSRLLLVFGVFFGHLALLKGILALSWSGISSPPFGPLLIPFAFAPLVLSVLLGRNLGILAAIFVSLWGGILINGLVPAYFTPAIFIVISLISGYVAVFVTLEVRQRSRLIRAGLFMGLATWVLAMVFRLIGPILPEFLDVNSQALAWQSLATVASGVFTAIIVSGILPILESFFHITTDISWLEAADLNHPLLKRMTIEAPGTYHHSLVVANLAEAAAEAIGANPTRARVCAYFHDIGKLVKPDYFSENTDPAHNPHNELAPTMSALIILAHVKEGVDLALKYNLKRQIIDVIAQHHGTSLVWYFYRRALQQQEDARQGGKIMNIREEDIPEVREESFRYSGPLPQTKECAIITLADAVESASRSLEKVTPQRVEQMIRDIMEQRIKDGQLDDCDLTLRELKTIAATFKSTLLSMLHSRVAYPKETRTSQPPADARAERERQERNIPPTALPPISAA